MIIDFIRLTRSRPDVDWSKYLTTVDMKVVKGRIFTTGWYSYDTFRNCGLAIYEEIANKNTDLVRQFEKFAIQSLE